VLVVEPNSTIRQILRKRLEAQGFKTLGADSGKAALKLASEWEPDVIVSGMLAFSDKDANLHRGLRASAKTAEIPVVLTSLINDPKVGLQVGVNAFVSRPVDRFELTRMVETQLARVRGPVLVVSPDRLEARTVQLVLGNEGYTVLLADETGWYELCRRENPALLVVDASLKDDLAREITTVIRRNGATSRAQVALITDVPAKDSHVIAAVLGKSQFTPDAELIGPVVENIRKAAGSPVA
jgi:DNA-binding response OmpR family regulator